MGGAEVLRLSILQELIRRGDFDVRVCVLRNPGILAARVEQLGIPVDVLGNNGGLTDLKGVMRLTGYLREHQPDIVQSSQFLTNFHTRLAAWRAKTPICIIEEHGIYTWKRWYHRLIDRQINSTAHGVVACSHKVAEFAAKILSIDKRRVTVIHNCAGAHHFLPADPSEDPNFIGDEASFRVGIIGTLRWEKGHEFLFDAWKQLIDGNRIPQDSQLLVVGDGPRKAELQRLASQTTGIQFLGQLSDTDTPRFLRSLDVFTLPSVNEGFGIVIVEAMCAGLPVVSTQSGGIPEVIDHGHTGYLVTPKESTPLADAIAYLYNQKSEREAMGLRAVEEAKKRFTPTRYTEQLVDLYDRLKT